MDEARTRDGQVADGHGARERARGVGVDGDGLGEEGHGRGGVGDQDGFRAVRRGPGGPFRPISPLPWAGAVLVIKSASALLGGAPVDQFEPISHLPSAVEDHELIGAAEAGWVSAFAVTTSKPKRKNRRMIVFIKPNLPIDPPAPSILTESSKAWLASRANLRHQPHAIIPARRIRRSTDIEVVGQRTDRVGDDE